ncbi:MAG: MFS transporter [Spirochaetaceae bacterium]|nr:MFS transporter [Spirochaetaceae bacterium]
MNNLTPYKQAKAREIFNFFTVLNSASWTFIAGNTVTLFAMRCKAPSFVIGVLSSLAYVSYFFLPLGKVAVKRLPIIKVFSGAWIIRSLCMTPVIAAPFALMLGKSQTALIILLISVAFFQIFRGIGMVSNNPVLNFLASGPDKSTYMTQTQVINNAVSMFAGFIVALCLGSGSAVWMYSLITITGVACGCGAGACIRRVPSPQMEEAKGPSFKEVLKKALADAPIKNFIIIFFFVALCSGVARTFIVVYARDVFTQSDGMTSLYGVFGAFGSFLIGLCIKFLVERIGAKPIFIICTGLGLVSLLVLVFLHPPAILGNESGTILILALIFLLLNFAFIGAENVGQTYFLCLVPKEFMLDMGIVYFVVFGVAGATGSIASGMILDALGGFGIDRMLAFKLLFIILVLLLATALILQRGLISLGALTVKDALEVIFSFRDLKAIAILDKLEKTKSVEREGALIAALQENSSPLAMAGLLERAKSPRFATRTEAIDALRTQETLSEEAEKALMEDVMRNSYTTAHQSARILGTHKCSAAIPLLRQSIHSGDYMLAGEAMIALARLNDEKSRPEIEAIIKETANPRLKIMGAEAFGVYKSVHSLPVLFQMYKTPNPPPYLRDEAALAIANILDIYNNFHKTLILYRENPEMTPALALDEVESAFGYYKSLLGAQRLKNKELPDVIAAQSLEAAVKAFTNPKKNDPAPLSRWLLGIPDSLSREGEALILSEAILQEDIRSFQRVQLLTVQWAAYILRLWAAVVKG